MFAQPTAAIQPALINGTAGVLITLDDQPTSLMAFTIAHERIAEIHAIVDPRRLATLDLTALALHYRP